MNKPLIPIIDIKKYGGKQVAIVDGKIAASGHTLEEVLHKVKQEFPSRPLQEIRIFSVPKTLSIFPFVSKIQPFSYR